MRLLKGVLLFFSVAYAFVLAQGSTTGGSTTGGSTTGGSTTSTAPPPTITLPTTNYVLTTLPNLKSNQILTSFSSPDGNLLFALTSSDIIRWNNSVSTFTGLLSTNVVSAYLDPNNPFDGIFAAYHPTSGLLIYTTGYGFKFVAFVLSMTMTDEKFSGNTFYVSATFADSTANYASYNSAQIVGNFLYALESWSIKVMRFAISRAGSSSPSFSINLSYFVTSVYQLQIQDDYLLVLTAGTVTSFNATTGAYIKLMYIPTTASRYTRFFPLDARRSAVYYADTGNNVVRWSFKAQTLTTVASFNSAPVGLSVLNDVLFVSYYDYTLPVGTNALLSVNEYDLSVYGSLQTYAPRRVDYIPYKASVYIPAGTLVRGLLTYWTSSTGLIQGNPIDISIISISPSLVTSYAPFNITLSTSSIFYNGLIANVSTGQVPTILVRGARPCTVTAVNPGTFPVLTCIAPAAIGSRLYLSIDFKNVGLDWKLMNNSLSYQPPFVVGMTPNSGLYLGGYPVNLTILNLGDPVLDRVQSLQFGDVCTGTNLTRIGANIVSCKSMPAFSHPGSYLVYYTMDPSQTEFTSVPQSTSLSFGATYTFGSITGKNNGSSFSVEGGDLLSFGAPNGASFGSCAAGDCYIFVTLSTGPFSLNALNCGIYSGKSTIDCITPPGIGSNLLISMTFNNIQMDNVRSGLPGFNYSFPTISLISPNYTSPKTPVILDIYGSAFGNLTALNTPNTPIIGLSIYGNVLIRVFFLAVNGTTTTTGGNVAPVIECPKVTWYSSSHLACDTGTMTLAKAFYRVVVWVNGQTSIPDKVNSTFLLSNLGSNAVASLVNGPIAGPDVLESAQRLPVPVSNSITCFESSKTLFNLSYADSDRFPANLSLTTLPTSGTLFQASAADASLIPIPITNATPKTPIVISNPGGYLYYVPNALFVGTDSFTFIATNAFSVSANSGTISLQVLEAVNMLGFYNSATQDIYNINQDGGGKMALSFSAGDPATILFQFNTPGTLALFGSSQFPVISINGRLVSPSSMGWTTVPVKSLNSQSIQGISFSIPPGSGVDQFLLVNWTSTTTTGGVLANRTYLSRCSATKSVPCFFNYPVSLIKNAFNATGSTAGGSNFTLEVGDMGQPALDFVSVFFVYDSGYYPGIGGSPIVLNPLVIVDRNYTHVICVSPPGLGPGPVAIYVQTLSGLSSNTLPFNYSSPTITSISDLNRASTNSQNNNNNNNNNPFTVNVFPTASGDVIQVLGSNFGNCELVTRSVLTPAAQVNTVCNGIFLPALVVWGVDQTTLMGTNAVRLSDSELRFNTPAGTGYNLNVMVKINGISSIANTAGETFNFDAPVITSIDPSSSLIDANSQAVLSVQNLGVSSQPADPNFFIVTFLPVNVTSNTTSSLITNNNSTGIRLINSGQLLVDLPVGLRGFKGLYMPVVYVHGQPSSFASNVTFVVNVRVRPTAFSTSATLLENNQVVLALNGSDDLGEPIQYFIRTSPSHGTLYNIPSNTAQTPTTPNPAFKINLPSANIDSSLPPVQVLDSLNRVIYVPSGYYYGNDSFSFSSFNARSSLYSDPVLVNLTVLFVDQSPNFTNPGPLVMNFAADSTVKGQSLDLKLFDVDETNFFDLCFLTAPTRGNWYIQGSKGVTIQAAPNSDPNTPIPIPTNLYNNSQSLGNSTANCTWFRVFLNSTIDGTSSTYQPLNFVVKHDNLGGSYPYTQFMLKARDSLGLESTNSFQVQVLAACGTTLFNAIWTSTGALCQDCPTGALCSNAGDSDITNAYGYYPLGSGVFIACDPSDACPVAGFKNGLMTCGDGYTGVRCGQCASRYYRLGAICKACPKVTITPVEIAIITILVLSILLCVFYLIRNADLGFIGIALTFIQALSLFRNLNLSWPPELVNLFNLFSVFNLNLEFTSPECFLLSDVTYTGSQLIQSHAVTGSNSNGTTTNYSPAYEFKYYLTLAFPIALALIVVVGILLHLFFVRIMMRFKFYRDSVFACKRALNQLFTGKKRETINISTRGKERAESIDALNGSTSKKSLDVMEGEGGIRANATEAKLVKLTDDEDIPFEYSLISVFLIALKLMYLIECHKALELFNCNYYAPSQVYYFGPEPSRLCYDPWWYKLLAVSVCSILFYVVGIPILFWVLFTARDRIVYGDGLIVFKTKKAITAAKLKNLDDGTGQLDDTGAVPIHKKIKDYPWHVRPLLYITYRKNSEYKDRFQYWDVIIMVRKLAIVTAQMFFSSNTAFQVVVFILIYFCSLLFQNKHQPYSMNLMNRLESSTLITSIIVLLGGILSFVGNFGESQLRILAYFLICLVMLCAIVVLTIMYKSFRAFQEKKRIEREGGEAKILLADEDGAAPNLVPRLNTANAYASSGPLTPLHGTNPDLHTPRSKLSRTSQGTNAPSSGPHSGIPMIPQSSSQGNIQMLTLSNSQQQNNIPQSQMIYTNAPPLPMSNLQYAPQSAQYAPQSAQYVSQSPLFAPQSPQFAPQSSQFAQRVSRQQSIQLTNIGNNSNGMGSNSSSQPNSNMLTLNTLITGSSQKSKDDTQ